MVKTNVRQPTTHRTHEGAVASRIGKEAELRRSVLSCLLWEQTFYESGQSIAERIADLVAPVAPETVAALAIEAREDMKLRHAPLWIVRAMAALPTHRSLVAKTLERVIQRVDEMPEFLSLYWESGRQPLSAQVKKGLAAAFPKFDAYQLAKYNRDGVKLRDVLFLTHPKPKDAEQAETWKQLVDGTLEAPDTWEVNLSAGKDKAETFTRLLAENKLGAMALLRNLRNMIQADVPLGAIRAGLASANVSRVLPFRFIAAAPHAPMLEPELELALFRSTGDLPKLSGETVVLVDVSGSMASPLSDRSKMSRIAAANGIAMLAREQCESVRVFSFSAGLAEVPARRGFALAEAIDASQPHVSTYLGAAVTHINNDIPHDRLIVVTDEQSHDAVPGPKHKGYMLNVASDQNGVGYGPWTHIDGFSEASLKYIYETETQQDGQGDHQTG